MTTSQHFFRCSLLSLTLQLIGCEDRSKPLAACMDSRLTALTAWSRYNSTLRTAAEQASRSGGNLEIRPANPPSGPFELAQFARTFEGVAGIASSEAAAAKAASEQMWQSCKLVCEDLLCTGIRSGGSGDQQARE